MFCSWSHYLRRWKHLHEVERLLLPVPARRGCANDDYDPDNGPNDDHDDVNRAHGTRVHPRGPAHPDLELWREPEQRRDLRIQAEQSRVQARAPRREPLCVSSELLWKVRTVTEWAHNHPQTARVPLRRTTRAPSSHNLLKPMATSFSTHLP